MKIRREIWTLEEDAILREEALARRPVAEIARSVSRTVSAVRSRAHVLRILLRQRKLN